MRKFYALIFAALLLTCGAKAEPIKVLFIGNSYTFYNNLPDMFAQVATSAGEKVTVDASTPGGYTLSMHCENSGTMAKIAQSKADFVVLQEQSQIPSFTDGEVNSMFLPYAQKLNDEILKSNPCSETVLYVTWGRKNGDAMNCPNWPPVCTYEGMDSLLTLRYDLAARQNQTIMSPVGPVWRFIRTDAPEIELYDADEGHPSLAGTFAAACTFYASIFRKDPSEITYNPGLDETVFKTIKNAAAKVTYHDLSRWYIGEYDVKAEFSAKPTEILTIKFQNESAGAVSYLWDFGDGNNSDIANPTHKYSKHGEYEVKLKSSNSCGEVSEVVKKVTTSLTRIEEPYSTTIQIYPNPTESILNFKNLPAMACTYEVFNALGMSLHSGELRDSKIELSALEPGIYFTRIYSGSITIYNGSFIKL